MFSRIKSADVVYVMLGSVLLLPALTLLFLQTFNAYSSEAETKRADALAAADVLMLLSDARARTDMAALRLLSRSRPLREEYTEAGVQRALEAIDLMPGWKALVLSDRASGEVLFDVSSDGVYTSGTTDIDLGVISPWGKYGGVERDGRHCPCIYFHIGVPTREDRVLTAVVDPMVYQTILRYELPDRAVAGIVDLEGEFIARSLDFYGRVGTPGTSYVLDAVHRGGRGIYEGKTYEGLVNYTAYATSDLTGWSSHIAIDSGLLDAPAGLANATLLAGALAAILIATVLFSLAARDVSLRRKEQQNVLELQRSEAVAQFTATVVHDFRNVIAALQAGLHLIKRRTSNTEIIQQVELIERSVAKGTRLANQLLSFSNSSESCIEPIHLGELITDARFLMEKAVGHGVTLHLETPPPDATVMANRDQLELALLNLALNARDAMQGAGFLRVEFKPLPDRIEILVSDSGPGVSPDARQSVFTAFHTTKVKGTGLGLAQVKGMARNAGGSVHVVDAEGGGACFVIALPRAKETRELTLVESA